MLKAIIVGAVTFVVLCVGIYVVLINSHIDIFPGVETTRDFDTDKLVRKETTVSLLDVSRGSLLDDERAELTAGGTIVEVLVVLVLPLILGVVAFWITRKMTASKPQIPAVPDEPQ